MQRPENKQTNQWSWLWLALSFGFMIFSDGQWAFALAPWIALPLLLRFVRCQKPFIGYLVAVAVMAIASSIGWYGLYPDSVPLPVQLFYYLLPSFILALPYLADRLMAHRLPGFLSTLIFPIAYIVMRYAMSFRPGNGTYGSLAYTQYGNLPLMQLVSITGIWGICFLIVWFASTINYCWENGFVFKRIKRVGVIYLCVLVAVLFYGGARLLLIAPAETVRVASVTTPPHALARIMGEIPGQSPFNLQESLAVLEKKTVKAADAGAKIIAWQEYADLISDEDIDVYVKRGQKIADQEDIYLLLTAGILDKDNLEKGENVSILIDPEGIIKWKYLKSYLVPMVEEPYFKKGDKEIPAEETPYGKIASVICFDNDHPRYIRSADNDVGLFLVPSFDGTTLTPVHSRMAVFRAIENGFSILKPTGRGLSIAADFCGRVIAKQNYFTSPKRVMLADVPVQSVFTIYSVIGNAFAWACIIGLIVLIGMTVIAHKQGKD